MNDILHPDIEWSQIMPGCYVGGHAGQYGIDYLADEFGSDATIAEMAALREQMEEDDASGQDNGCPERRYDLADAIESAINDRLPEHLVAHWFDGEFMISPYCGDECDDETCYCQGW